MTFPIVRHHDAGQIRVLVETYSEQVPNLALEEVGAGPDGGQRVDVGIFSLKFNFQPQILLFASREKLIDDLETGLARQPVDAGDIGKRVIGERRIVLQREAGLAQGDAMKPDDQLAAIELGASNGSGVPRQQRGDLRAVLQLLDVGDCRLKSHLNLLRLALDPSKS